MGILVFPVTLYISWTPPQKLVIKIFQNRRLEILKDVPQIDAFRTPEHVEVSEFTEVNMTLKTY